MSVNNKRAPKPPMGWNSWISYACYVREDEVKAHADYMAKHLLPFGYDTIVIDAGWASTLPPHGAGLFRLGSKSRAARAVRKGQ